MTNSGSGWSLIQMCTNRKAFPTWGMFPTAGFAHFAQRQDAAVGRHHRACGIAHNPSVPEATWGTHSPASDLQQAILNCFYNKQNSWAVISQEVNRFIKLDTAVLGSHAWRRVRCTDSCGRWERRAQGHHAELTLPAALCMWLSPVYTVH